MCRADVTRTRQDIAKFKRAEVQEEMEKLLLIYCKRRSVKYTQGLNELLAPFLDLREDPPPLVPLAQPFDRNEIFTAFHAFVQKFIPNTLRGHDLKTLRRSLQLVRILLRYHYPKVSTVLDKASIGPDFYATGWLATLFASTNALPVVHVLWDQLIIHDDPSLIYLLAVAMVGGQEEAILAADGAQDELMTLVKKAGTIFAAAEVKTLFDAAVRLSVSTPRSFRRLVHRATIQVIEKRGRGRGEGIEEGGQRFLAVGRPGGPPGRAGRRRGRGGRPSRPCRPQPLPPPPLGAPLPPSPMGGVILDSIF